MHRSALVSSTLAPVALVGGWTWAAKRQPGGFDAVEDTISALAATDATDRSIMTGGLAGLGSCHLVTAAGLPEIGTAARAVLAAGGATAIGVALLPQPNRAHIPVATASFVALAAWPALATTKPRWLGAAATATLAGLLEWLAVAIKQDHHVGRVERIAAAAEAIAPLAWAVGLKLISNLSASTAVYSRSADAAISSKSASRVTSPHRTKPAG